MPISTVKYSNTFKNAIFKWFLTIFSLGAPELKQREKNVVLVASPLRILSMIKLKQVNKRKSSPGASNLITARQTNPDLLDLSSVCETVKPRSL